MRLIPYDETFEPDIVLDWKQFSDEALEEFDRVLARHGLEIVTVDDGSDTYCMSIVPIGK
jgi:hypothetical protein